MTTVEQRPARARRPPKRRRRWPRVVGLAAALIVAFALGLSLGKALNDGPEPGRTITTERTLEQPP